MFYCLYYYIIHLYATRAVLRVHDDGTNRSDVCLWERPGGSDSTPGMANMELVVRYLHPVDVTQNDQGNVNGFRLIAIMIFVKGSESTTL